jgi:hypothetical protein
VIVNNYCFCFTCSFSFIRFDVRGECGFGTVIDFLGKLIDKSEAAY